MTYHAVCIARPEPTQVNDKALAHIVREATIKVVIDKAIAMHVLAAHIHAKKVQNQSMNVSQCVAMELSHRR